MHRFVVAGVVAFSCLALVGCGGTVDAEEQVGEMQEELNNGRAFGGSFLVDDCGANNVATPLLARLPAPSVIVSTRSIVSSTRRADAEAGSSSVVRRRAAFGFRHSRASIRSTTREPRAPATSAIREQAALWAVLQAQPRTPSRASTRHRAMPGRRNTCVPGASMVSPSVVHTK
jgi:hypothetical protein